jgi:tetratricopeptide (TPR) repeat protein
VFHKPTPFRFESDRPSATIVIPKSTRNPLFEETSDRAIRTAHRRKWTLVAALGACLGAGLGVWWYLHNEHAAARALTVEYLGIEALHAEELTKFQERLTAAGEATDFSAEPDHSASAAKFADFARRHPDEPLAWHVAIRASSLLIAQKKPQEAQTLLEQVARKTLSNNIAQARIRRTLAGIHADAGQFDKALTEIDFALKLPGNPVLEETKLLRGQVLYLAGRKDEAATVLKELAAAPDAGAPGASSAATEASLWLGHWGL